MHVSIIIRSKDEERAIGSTLERIFVQEAAVPFEVVLVDSGSSDGTLGIARRFPVRTFHIPPESFSFGYALNYGIERAEGRIIVNLSAHCTPVNASWLRELVAPIMAGAADATYGRQLPVQGVNPFEEVSLNKHYPSEGTPRGRVPFSNANCAFLKGMWNEVRFDEALPSWEDFLWYLLLKDRYRFAYCPKAEVYHSHAFSIRDTARRSRNDGRAFRMFQTSYGIDLFEDVCPSVTDKLKLFGKDLGNHVRFFRKNGYIKHIVLTPVVRFLAYRSYWKGYNSVR